MLKNAWRKKVVNDGDGEITDLNSLQNVLSKYKNDNEYEYFLKLKLKL